MTPNTITWVGMDAHKNSIAVAALFPLHVPGHHVVRTSENRASSVLVLESCAFEMASTPAARSGRPS